MWLADIERLRALVQQAEDQKSRQLFILNININATMKVIVKYVIFCLSPPGYTVNEVMMLRNL